MTSLNPYNFHANRAWENHGVQLVLPQRFEGNLDEPGGYNRRVFSRFPSDPDAGQLGVWILQQNEIYG